MALNFQIPDKLKAKNLQTLQKGFGTPIISSLTPSIPNVPLGDFPEGITKFGTYYYDALFIEAPDYETPVYDESTQEFTTIEKKAMFSPDFITRDGELVSGVWIKGAICDVTSTNNIVKTEIAGQNGTVKEYINQGDYSITIRGFFDNILPDKYPFIRTNLLRFYAAAPVSMGIVNDFLNNVFKINKIAIERVNIFQQQGLRNIQYFVIDASSDTVIDIKELSK